MAPQTVIELITVAAASLLGAAPGTLTLLYLAQRIGRLERRINALAARTKSDSETYSLNKEGEKS